MKFLWTLLLFLSVNLGAVTPAGHNVQSAAVLEATHAHYNGQGAVRSYKTLKAFLDSAWRVSGMISAFPSTDPQKNWLALFAYGSRESSYKKDFVQVNIPGKAYPGLGSGKTVNHFSIDYGWTGLNQINVRWAYLCAKALQEGKKLPPEVCRNITKETQLEIVKVFKIPKTLKLKRIDLRSARLARTSYNWYLTQPISPERIKINVPYQELTKDDLDSMLIYRALVEIDRRNRGWEWESWDGKLFNLCLEASRETIR